MFLERKVQGKSGWIEVITGCMFSGKTEELLRRIRRAEIAGLKVSRFKPVIDNRYGSDIVSHDRNGFPCRLVKQSREIPHFVDHGDVVAIDEVQFFDDEILEICMRLADHGHRVIVAGLDMDANRKPFGPMPNLLACAEFVTKLHAICVETGELASFSFRKSGSNEQVEVGGNDKYEARSRGAWVAGKVPPK